MHLRRHESATTSLSILNDDCLLLICAHLTIGEQFALLQLDGRFEQLVLRIWQCKYAKVFDWQQEPQLKLLSAGEQCQLLEYMVRITRSLLNLSDSDILLACLTRKLKRKRKWQAGRMGNMQRLSLTQCNVMLLRQLPQIGNNLAQLQLGNCMNVTPGDLSTLFAQLPVLNGFELLPGSSICDAKTVDLANIEYGQMLHRLKLPACAVRAASRQIARLPQLQQLTGFLCCSNDGDIDDDKEMANGGGGNGGVVGGVATATISACLKALSASCQIVALSLQCQLDASLPRLLQGHLGQLVWLQRFAWHSLLMVHYDAKDGSIKWLPQAPQVARAMLRFIVSQAKQASAGLRELDFTRNVHATPTFLAQLGEQLLQPSRELAVWHDGCPRDRMANEETDMQGNRNDLAFVQLQWKHLANEKSEL